MKATLYILLVGLLLSCSSARQVKKSDQSRAVTEQEETRTFRKGDTVTFQVPKITLKDTTIYTVNRQGTTLRTVYDGAGNISQIDCFASMIEEITRRNWELVEVIRDKEKQTETEINPITVLYIMIGFALIIAVVLFILLRNVMGTQKLIQQILRAG